MLNEPMPLCIKILLNTYLGLKWERKVPINPLDPKSCFFVEIEGHELSVEVSFDFTIFLLLFVEYLDKQPFFLRFYTKL